MLLCLFKLKFKPFSPRLLQLSIHSEHLLQAYESEYIEQKRRGILIELLPLLLIQNRFTEANELICQRFANNPMVQEQAKQQFNSIPISSLFKL